MKIIRRASWWDSKKETYEAPQGDFQDLPEHAGEFGLDGRPIDPGLGSYNEEQMEAEFAESYANEIPELPKGDATIANLPGENNKIPRDVFNRILEVAPIAEEPVSEMVGDQVVTTFKIPASSFLSAIEYTDVDIGDVETEIFNLANSNYNAVLDISVQT